MGCMRCIGSNPLVADGEFMNSIKSVVYSCLWNEAEMHTPVDVCVTIANVGISNESTRFQGFTQRTNKINK